MYHECAIFGWKKIAEKTQTLEKKRMVAVFLVKVVSQIPELEHTQRDWHPGHGKSILMAPQLPQDTLFRGGGNAASQIVGGKWKIPCWRLVYIWMLENHENEPVMVGKYNSSHGSYGYDSTCTLLVFCKNFWPGINVPKSWVGIIDIYICKGLFFS